MFSVPHYDPQGQENSRKPIDTIDRIKRKGNKSSKDFTQYENQKPTATSNKDVAQSDAQVTNDKKLPKREKKRHKVHDDGKEDETDTPKSQTGILAKYHATAKSKVSKSRSPSPMTEAPALPLQTLPEPNLDIKPVSISKTAGLPDWLATPLLVDPTSIMKWTKKELKLSDDMRKKLVDRGYGAAFAVQKKVIPMLVATPELWSPDIRSDICVHAPTGSGKTLAYALPIVEILSKRVVTKLRALIIVPTRELVAQVRDVFHSLTTGTKLQIATAMGHNSFMNEQSVLLDHRNNSRHDVLICTPGRLVDHMCGTEGFTLQWLRFLVIDEADRLLDQSFHNWLPIVNNGIEKQPDCVIRDVNDVIPHQCQKLVFSATMTRNLEQISLLKLRNPQLVAVQEIDTAEANDHEAGILAVPPNLSENAIILSAKAEKPITLFRLVETEHLRRSLVFVASTESSARLARLLQIMFERASMKISIESITGELSKRERQRRLHAFDVGVLDILVCSDLISRGMDVNVSHVINYDAPSTIRTYIHRVGRTARAMKAGTAWTFVTHHQRKQFSGMMKRIERNGKYTKIKVGEDTSELYENALKQLEGEVRKKV